MTARFYTYDLVHYNAGVGGTSSWYGLIRLQADVLVNDPSVVFMEFCVNDSADDTLGTRVNGFAPAAEALIRRTLTDSPNAKLIAMIFKWPNNYSLMSDGLRLARDKWIALANLYGLSLYRWDTYLESLMGAGYNDTDVDAYLSAHGNVHPNDAGHDAAFDLIVASLTNLSGGSGALPEPYYAETADFEQTPIIRNGTDNDGETGAGWSTSGTARQSSTADNTISWSGTFCSFGLDTNYSTGAGTLAWSVDGGAYTNVDLSASGVANFAVSNFARAAHTVTIKVVSGLVKINRFLAI